MITWRERLQNLRAALGREPTVDELLEVAQVHTMTKEERQAQAESWVRGMMPTGDPSLD